MQRLTDTQRETLGSAGLGALVEIHSQQPGNSGGLANLVRGSLRGSSLRLQSSQRSKVWLVVSAQAASIWEGRWHLTLSAHPGGSLSTLSLSTRIPSLRTSSIPHAGGAKEAKLWLLEETD